MSQWVKNSDFILIATRLSRGWTRVPKNHLTQVGIRASFILKGEGLWLVIENYLIRILYSCICPCRSGYIVSLYLQHDKCYMNGKMLYLKSQNLENGLFFIFQAIGSILNLQQKQQNTKVKVKKTDPIWSQICSSLLQFFWRNHILVYIESEVQISLSKRCSK